MVQKQQGPGAVPALAIDQPPLRRRPRRRSRPQRRAAPRAPGRRATSDDGVVRTAPPTGAVRDCSPRRADEPVGRATYANDIDRHQRRQGELGRLRVPAAALPPLWLAGRTLSRRAVLAGRQCPPCRAVLRSSFVLPEPPQRPSVEVKPLHRRSDTPARERIRPPAREDAWTGHQEDAGGVPRRLSTPGRGVARGPGQGVGQDPPRRGRQPPRRHARDAHPAPPWRATHPGQNAEVDQRDRVDDLDLP